MVATCTKPDLVGDCFQAASFSQDQRSCANEMPIQVNQIFRPRSSDNIFTLLPFGNASMLSPINISTISILHDSGGVDHRVKVPNES